MASRLRSKAPTISLFSFQDIVTSVTAIVILIVLLMTLELITRVEKSGVSAEDQRTARALASAIGEMEALVQQLRTEASDLTRAASDAAGYSVHDTVEREQTARQEAQALRDAIRTLEVELRDARAEQRARERELSRANSTEVAKLANRAEAMLTRAAEIETTNRNESRRQAEERKALVKDEGGARTLIFNVPPGSSLRPLLVELSGDGLVAASVAGEAVERFSWGIFGTAPTGFTNWLKSRDPTREYVVLLLRPSGVARYNSTRQSIVDAGLEVGTELIGEQISVRLGTGK